MPTPGKLKWHYQFTPHDELDYDSTQVPVLADIQFRGPAAQGDAVGESQRPDVRPRSRRPASSCSARPYVKVNWAGRLRRKGRPQRVPGNGPDQGGHASSSPHVHGATNWAPPSFSPRTGLFYVAHFENSSTVAVEGEFPRANGINPRQTTMGQINLQNFLTTRTRPTASCAPTIRTRSSRSGNTRWPTSRGAVS